MSRAIESLRSFSCVALFGVLLFIQHRIGKTVDIDGVILVRMDNGKIAEERDFLDNLEFMQQLGLIPR